MTTPNLRADGIAERAAAGIWQRNEQSNAAMPCQWITLGAAPILQCTHTATRRIVTEIGPAIDPVRWFDYTCIHHVDGIAQWRVDAIKAGRE